MAHVRTERVLVDNRPALRDLPPNLDVDKDDVQELLLLNSGRLAHEIDIALEDAAELWPSVQFAPDLSVLLGERKCCVEVPGLGVLPGRNRGEEEPSDNAATLHYGKPVARNPSKNARHIPRIARQAMAMEWPGALHFADQDVSGRSLQASTSSRRGIRTISSPAPHPVPGGKAFAASAVMSTPMIARSPVVISRISGQLCPPEQVAGPPPEPIPSRRANMMAVHINAFICAVNRAFSVAILADGQRAPGCSMRRGGPHSSR